MSPVSVLLIGCCLDAGDFITHPYFREGEGGGWWCQLHQEQWEAEGGAEWKDGPTSPLQQHCSSISCQRRRRLSRSTLEEEGGEDLQLHQKFRWKGGPMRHSRHHPAGDTAGGAAHTKYRQWLDAINKLENAQQMTTHMQHVTHIQMQVKLTAPRLPPPPAPYVMAVLMRSFCSSTLFFFSSDLRRVSFPVAVDEVSFVGTDAALGDLGINDERLLRLNLGKRPLMFLLLTVLHLL